MYSLRPDRRVQWSQGVPRAYNVLLNKYYVDEAYDAAIVEPTKQVGLLWDWVDRTIIDGIVRAVGRMTQAGSMGSTWFEKYVIYGLLNVIGYTNHLAAWSWRKLQSGMVHHYAAIIVGGLFLLVHLMLALWTGSITIGLALK